MRVRRSIVLMVLMAFAPGWATAQQRSELRVWTARALATVLAEIGPQFERAHGVKLVVTSDLPNGFLRRANGHEPFDLLITSAATVDQWIKDGRVVANTRTDVSRSGIGVEVRAGTPKPDIRSVDAFKRALIDAKSIAYLPVGSGLYLAHLFEQLGIADAVQAKATRPDADIVSELVAKGQIELGIVVITQILTTPGVELVGPLPAEIQSYVTFTAGISATAGLPDAAQALISFLIGPDAAQTIKSQGMEPTP